MGIQLLETNHKAYGRVLVNEEELQTAEPFTQVRLLNPPSTVRDMSLLTVGKAALKDQGGYVQPEGRADKTRIEMYLPLVYKAVHTMARLDDDRDELFSEGCLGLVEADKRFKAGSNNGFAAYAKPYIMGYIKNFQNPERQGLMNIVELHEEHFNIAGEDTSVSEVMDAMLTTLDSMTKVQREIMLGLYVTGHSMSNMAKITNSTKQNIMYHRDRALKVIRRKLNGV